MNGKFVGTLETDFGLGKAFFLRAPILTKKSSRLWSKKKRTTTKTTESKFINRKQQQRDDNSNNNNETLNVPNTSHSFEGHTIVIKLKLICFLIGGVFVLLASNFWQSTALKNCKRSERIDRNKKLLWVSSRRLFLRRNVEHSGKKQLLLARRHEFQDLNVSRDLDNFYWLVSTPASFAGIRRFVL